MKEAGADKESRLGEHATKCTSNSVEFCCRTSGTRLATMVGTMSAPLLFRFRALPLLALAVLGPAAGCGSSENYIPGTEIPRSPTNEQIVRRLEQYRLAVEAKDTGRLLLMASPRYWEDGGTTDGKDDYGYAELRDVLNGRFKQAKNIRYSMRYMRIRRKQNRAYVEVMVDGSYTLPDARGDDVREDKRDQNQLVLEWDPNKEQWMFLSGY
jgi:hypothetical protein